MKMSEHYESDVLFFFEGRAQERCLYEAFFDAMCRRFPGASVKVQKSQISFYGRHLFAAASLPVRRRKGWPEHCILVTFGLGRRLESPRIAVAVEPYPNRWTHHIVVERKEQLDEELLGWVQEAWAFGEAK